MSQSVMISHVLIVYLVITIHIREIITGESHSIADQTSLELYQPSKVNISEQFWKTVPTRTETLTPHRKNEDSIESSESVTLNRLEVPPKSDENFSKTKTSEEVDEEIPPSEHEYSKDVSSKPDYQVPGDWAKPPKDKYIKLDFIPTKLHAQVRGTHTVKRLPREEATESAGTQEEKENAARLREVVTNSKVNTVYTEEGYEDSAYDHAGEIRNSDFHEGFAKNLQDQVDVEQETANDQANKSLEDSDDYSEDYRDHYERSFLPDPEINPKLITKAETQKLQRDLEAEDEESEDNSAINRLQSVPLSEEEVNYDDQESVLIESDGSPDSYNPGVRIQEMDDGKPSPKNENINIRTYEYTSSPSKIERVPTDSALTEQAISAGEYPDQFTKTPSKHSQHESHHGLFPEVPRLPNSLNQGKDGEQTTVGYSDLLWDFFKSKQKQSATNHSLIQETTTWNPGLLPATVATTVVNQFRGLPDVSEERTTVLPPPITDPETFVEPFAPTNEDALRETSERNAEDIRHILSINRLASESNDPVLATSTPFWKQKPVQEAWQSAASQGIPGSNSSDSSDITGPKMNASADATRRPSSTKRPRYKVLLRHVLKKFPGSQGSKKHEATVSNKLRESRVPLADNIGANENYLKMLSYIKNTKTRKAQADELGSKGRSGFRVNINAENSKDLTRMWPPSPQMPEEVTFFNFLPDHSSRSRLMTAGQPSVAIESETAQEIRSEKVPFSPSHYIRSSKLIQSPSGYPDPLIKSLDYDFWRNSMPATRLLPPAPSLANDFEYPQDNEKSNHFLYAGNQSKQSPSLARTFRYAPITFDMLRQFRSRIRKRRTTKQEEDDEIVKAESLETNNGTSNGKSERAGKTSLQGRITNIKRNLAQKVTREMDVDFVPDMSGFLGKQTNEKKSMVHHKRNDHSSLQSLHEESNNDVSDRESGAFFKAEKPRVNSNPNISPSFKNDPKTFETNLIPKKSPPLPQVTKVDKMLGRLKREVIQEFDSSHGRSRHSNRRKTHEELLNESPGITDDVIEKEINDRFNEQQREGKNVAKVQIEVPGLDYVEELLEDDDGNSVTTTEMILDLKKYPFYRDDRIPAASPLKYIVEPRSVPRKSNGGMEFYDHRDSYKKCVDIEPDLQEVIPEEEEPDGGFKEGVPRLGGLGDKLDCFKAKYFDDDPFDNPLFLEKEVGDPIPPSEFDSPSLTAKLILLPKTVDEYIVREASRKPEEVGPRLRKPVSGRLKKLQKAAESVQLNFKPQPTSGKGRDAYLHTLRESSRRNPRKANRIRFSGTTKRPVSNDNVSSSSTLSALHPMPFQNQVYEDVMGNIRHLAKTYEMQDENVAEPSTHSVSNIVDDIRNERNSNFSLNSVKPQNSSTTLVNKAGPSKLNNVLSIRNIIRPRYQNKRPIYRRNRGPYRSRGGSRKLPPGSRILYQKIKIRKRSIQNGTLSDISSKNVTTSKPARKSDEHVEPRSALKVAVSSANETIDAALAGVSNRKRVNAHGSTSTRTPSEADDEDDEEASTVSPRIYTIRDRIRHSRPKESARGIGKFLINGTINEDHRRKEPRYNSIKRRKVQEVSVSPVSLLPNSNNETLKNNSYEQLREESRESEGSFYTARKVLPGINIKNHSKNESMEDLSGDSKRNHAGNLKLGYAVHEKIDEEVMSASPKSMSSTMAPEVTRLQTYLKSDSTGYKEALPEEEAKNEASKCSDCVFNATKFGIQDESSDSSYHSSEESSGKLKKEDQDEKMKSLEESRDSKEDESFFKHSLESPFQSKKFLDEKPPDFGSKTVDSPFFYPPSFSTSKNLTISGPSNEDEDTESEDSDDKKNDGDDLPWYKVDDDEHQHPRYHHRLISRYEFPWERRERLEKESRGKKDLLQRLKEILNEDEDEMKNNGGRVYAWDSYDKPTSQVINRHRPDDDNDADSTETSSRRSTMRFSSRYNSDKINLPVSDRPLEARLASIENINRSIKTFLEDNLEHKPASKKTEDESLGMKSVSSSKRSRGVFGDSVIPESITLLPTKKPETNGSPQLFVSEDIESSLQKDWEDEKVKDDADESSKLGRHNLDKAESGLRSMRTEPAKFESTTRASYSTTTNRSRKRRKHLKNLSSTTETSVSETASKSRRRQKPLSPTLAAKISPTESGLMTSSPKVIRGRHAKLINDTKKNILNVTSIITSNNDKHHQTGSTTPKSRSSKIRGRLPRGKSNLEKTQSDQSKTASNQKQLVEGIKRNEESSAGNEGTEGSPTRANRKQSYEDVSRGIGSDVQKLAFPVAINDDIRAEQSSEEQSLKNDKQKLSTNFGMLDSQSMMDDDDFESILKADDNIPRNSPENRLNRAIPSGNARGEGNEGNRNRSGQETKAEVNNENGEELERQDAGEERIINEDKLAKKFIKEPEKRFYYYVEEK